MTQPLTWRKQQRAFPDKIFCPQLSNSPTFPGFLNKWHVMDACYGHHFNNQTKKIWRKMAMSRTAMSRSLKFSDHELPPVSDAGICRSNACMFDVSVASLSAMSRCCRISGSSSWWSVALSQTLLGSCVRACCWSSSKNIMTLTRQPQNTVRFLCWHELYWSKTSAVNRSH